ncbi:coxsackievirus and adenovirus receptor-like [Perca fluviatilis]|uniref:coxsackievirus and adenovirus receptor-like n=1 Tax=Perca fluviatilis TaxID=8168 RepID=UPI0019658AAB|nr:coxsackievirus and adenovirus receptor-like [Perca fluviatilis]
MAPFLFLLLFLSGATSDLIEVTVNHGDDVILPCQAADSAIIDVKWSRPDLEPDTVLLYRDGHLDTEDQHHSFKGRVELVDRDLKDGNVSLILKNVNIHDAGTYECRAALGGSGRTKGDTDSEPIRTFRLQVPEPADMTVIPVPGENAILPCYADDISIRLVKWTRADLKPDTVLLYRDGDLNTDDQHPSFKNRVELRDRDMKDGDVSLTLKNVNIIDSGIYECGVKTGDSTRTKGDTDSDPIKTMRILLQVPDQDRIVVTVDPGQDAILPCQAADSSISIVEWTRPDLEPDIVFLYRYGYLDPDDQHPDDQHPDDQHPDDQHPDDQHPSFKDRVELVDRDLKDGDVSLILKNVSRNDRGTYKCLVITVDSMQITIIDLQVPGNSSPVGRYVGLAAGGLLLVAAAVVGVLIYRRRENKRSGQPADEASADNFI